MPPPPCPETILIYVGIDAVGDGLFKLPFVRGLRALFPAARLTWLAGKGPSVYARGLAPLVAPLIDEVVDEAGIGSRPAVLRRRPLGGRAFELGIDTQRRLLTTLILRRVRHRRFVSAAAGHLLSDARPPRRRGKPASMAAQLADLAELAAGRPLPPLPPLVLPDDATAEAARLLPDGGRYLALAPGAGGRHKCWPLDRYLALAAQAEGMGLTPVVVLGPAEAATWVAPVRAALPGARLPLQDAADPSPMLTIALGRRCAAAIANDSGAGHMLAAADIPLLSLVGPTPAEKFPPATPRGRVLRAQDFGDSAMTAIPVEAVAAALRGLLA